MRKLQFYFSEVDVTINIWELLSGVIGGIAVIGIPCLIQWLGSIF